MNPKKQIRVLLVVLASVLMLAATQNYFNKILSPWINGYVWVIPTSGYGTVGSPWTHTDNSGGINTALAIPGATVVNLRPGFYSASVPIVVGSGQTLNANGATIVSSATSSGVVLGDATKEVVTVNPSVRDLYIQCTGTGTKCVRVVVTNQFFVDELDVLLQSTGQTGLYFDGAGRSDTAQDGHIGNFYGTVGRVEVCGGSCGGSSFAGTSGNTGVELAGSEVRGRDSANNFGLIHVVNCKYGLVIGPAYGNNFDQVTIEHGEWSTESRNVLFKSGANTNIIRTLTTENAHIAGVYRWGGISIEAQRSAGDLSNGVAEAGAKKNEIKNWFRGGASNPTTISIFGSNKVWVGNTVFVNTPDDSGDGEDGDVSGTDDPPLEGEPNLTVDYTTGSLNPYHIRIPSELGDRVTLGTKGLGLQNVGEYIGNSVSIASLTRSSAVATVTTSGASGVATGYYVDVTGCTQPEYNGRFYATKIDATHFTYKVGGAPVTPATGSCSYKIARPLIPPLLVDTGGQNIIRQGVTPSNNVQIHLGDGHHVYFDSWDTTDGNITVTNIYPEDIYSNPVVLFEVTPTSANLSLLFDNNETAVPQHVKYVSAPLMNPRYKAVSTDGTTATGASSAAWIDPVSVSGAYHIKIHFPVYQNTAQTGYMTYYWWMVGTGSGTSRTWRMVTPIYGPAE